MSEVFRIVDAGTGRQWPRPGARAMATTGQPANLPNTTLLIGKGGHSIPIEGTVSPLADETGQVVGTAIVVREANERERNKDAAEASPEHIPSVARGPAADDAGRKGYRASPSGTRTSSIDSWNTAPRPRGSPTARGGSSTRTPVYRMFKLPEGDLVGKGVFDIYPPDRAREVPREHRRSPRTGRALETIESEPAGAMARPRSSSSTSSRCPPGRRWSVAWPSTSRRLEQKRGRGGPAQRAARPASAGAPDDPGHGPRGRHSRHRTRTARSITVQRALADMLGMPSGENVSRSREARGPLPFKLLKDGEELPPELPMQRAADGVGHRGRGTRDPPGRRAPDHRHGERTARPRRLGGGRWAWSARASTSRRCARPRRAAGGRSSQGRVPRDAGPRAAEPPGRRSPTPPSSSDARTRRPGSGRATIIERQVRHLARLVDDLLDVSRITRGKIELRKETVDAVDGHRPRRRVGAGR